MAQSFYFYDTETTGTRASIARIMQFAGQRTSMDLQPIGEPDDFLIKLSPDILPEPDAVLVHGITPQKTLEDGVTEAEFCAYFHKNIATPDTIFVGFNSVRFDDEFLRYMFYRNFYEPYEWQWKDGRSRWDIMDPLRMMRALRPDGINWPFQDGKPTVRLELMTKENGIDHTGAHTAVADVLATIKVAKLLQTAQPKLFNYLLNMRTKTEVAKLVEAKHPFVYTSGKYSNDWLKTTVVLPLFKHPRREAMLVYDLRYDPTELLELSEEELQQRWEVKYGEDVPKLPIKTLQYNRCPAIAPLSVLDSESQKRLRLDLKQIAKHQYILAEAKDFTNRLRNILGVLEEKQTAMQLADKPADAALYDSFWSDQDRYMLAEIRKHPPVTLHELLPKIKSKRMQKLLPLYKARNYPQTLSPEERDSFEVYRHDKLIGGGNMSEFAKFYERLQVLARTRQNSRDEYLLTELQLYAESIMPYNAD